MSDPILMQEMTSAEIGDSIERGRDVAVFACGAVEQHGPHLPLATDSLIGEVIVERAARMAGNALVAPTVLVGLSEHHMGFPGSLCLRPDTFLAVLEDLCDSLARHKFRRIVLYPSHGGNVDVMRAHVPFIAKRMVERVELRLASESILGGQRWEVMRAYGITPGRAGAHAGWTETSMMLAAFPDLVRVSAMKAGLTDEAFYAPESVAKSQMASFVHGIQAQSPNGVLGDPTGADAAAGEKLIDLAAASLARDLTG